MKSFYPSYVRAFVKFAQNAFNNRAFYKTLTRFATILNRRAYDLLKRAARNPKIDFGKLQKELQKIGRAYIKKFADIIVFRKKNEKKKSNTLIESWKPDTFMPIKSQGEMLNVEGFVMKDFQINFIFENGNYQASVTEVIQDEFHVLLFDNALASRFGLELTYKKTNTGILLFISDSNIEETLNKAISGEILFYLRLKSIIP